MESIADLSPIGRASVVERLLDELSDGAVRLSAPAGFGATTVARSVASAWTGSYRLLSAARCHDAIETGAGRRGRGPSIVIIDDAQWCSARARAMATASSDRQLWLVRTGVPTTRAGDVTDLDDIAGFDLSPLDVASSAALVERLHPGWSVIDRAAVVRAAHGRPRLLCGARPTGLDPLTTLWLSAWVADLDPAAIHPALIVALAGGTALTDDLRRSGVDVEPATNAGLLAGDGPRCALLHPALETPLREAVTPARMKDALEVATNHADPTVLARRFAELGRGAAARLASVRAAAIATPVQRVENARLLVTLSPHALCPAESFDIARASFDNAQLEATIEACVNAERGSASVRARALLLRGRAHWFRSEPELAGEAWRQALALGSECGPEVVAEALAHLSCCALRFEWDLAGAHALAEEALALQAAGRGGALAHLMRAHAGFLRDPQGPGWRRDLDIGARRAALHGDVDLIAEVTNVLVSVALWSGRLDEVQTLVTELLRYVDRHPLLDAWTDGFRPYLLLIDAMRGTPVPMLDLADLISGRAARHVHVLAFQALSAGLAGRIRDAEQLVGVASATVSGDRNGPAMVAWAEAEIQLASGRPGTALEAIERALSLADDAFPLVPVFETTAAWCARALGEPQRAVRPAIVHGIAAACEHELVGIAAMDHDPALAVAAFDRAAARWAGIWLWGQLRCELTAAELARDIRLEDLGDRIERAAQLSRDAACAPAAGRLARLRRAVSGRGDRPDRQLDQPNGFSPREAQAAELSRQGLTSREIAGQLGLTPRTVDHYLESAQAKSGARNRSELITRSADRSGRRAVLVDDRASLEIGRIRAGDVPIVEVRATDDVGVAIGVLERARAVIVLLPKAGQLRAVATDDLARVAEIDPVCLGRRRTDRLSADQLIMLIHIARGATTTEVAQAMALSVRTTERRMSVIRRELGVVDRRSAIDLLVADGVPV